MANTKQYSIKINGLTESINAVDALNKQLDKLEQRMKTLSSSKTSSGGSSRGSSELSEEEQVQKEINKLKQEGQRLDAKIAATQDEIYKRVDATKQLYKETLADQKAIAAQERLTANAYSNTMVGMKQQLADLKAVIQTMDLGDSEGIKKMTEQANELTNKLKEMEEAYGQFGRNVGNYASALDGLDKITVEVGGVVREFNSAREAAKTLKNELTALEIQGKSNTKEAKDLRNAYYNLKSAMDDATKSSKAMDTALDTMQSFTALSSIGNGLRAFFGLDNNEITKSIQRLVALQGVLNGLETLRKQMETGEGIGQILAKGSEGVDRFVASITAAEIGVNGLVKSSKAATVAVRALSIALKAVGIGLVVAAITGLMQIVEKATGAIQSYFKGNADLANASNVVRTAIEAENNALQKQRDLLASRFMKGYISDTEYAIQNALALKSAIIDTVDAIQKQAFAMDEAGDKIEAFMNIMATGTFDEKGLPHKDVRLNSNPFAFWDDIPVLIKNLEGAKTAWKEYYEAVKKGQDIISSRGARNPLEWIESLIITADDAKDTWVQIGQVIAADWVRTMNTIDTESDEGRKKLAELVSALDNDEVTRSVMMNLADYFHDKEIIAKIENLMKYARELNNSFQFDAEATREGAEYWAQVRIDAMKNGAAKVRAQIELDKKKELEQLNRNGQISAEHQKQIDEKYNRRLIEQTKQFGQQQRDAQNDLINLRIQAMKEGLAKELAQLEQERKERIQKVRQSGILVGERTLAINNLYDKKILDAKKKWAADITKVYEDLYANIMQVNRATFNMEGDTASQNTQNKAAKGKLDVGYSSINRSNFDDSKNLAEYYKKVLDIEKKASEQELQITRERLEKELEFNQKEEELRHKRVADINNGELKQQLEAGKITQEQYNKLMEDENDAHYARMNALDKEYAAQLERVTQEQMEEVRSLYNGYYESIISDIKKDKQEIDKIMSKQPEVDKNGWGVVNMGKTSSNYDAALKQYDVLKQKILQKQAELDQSLKEKKISPEDFAMKQSALKKEMDAIDQAVRHVQEKQKELVKDFLQSIQQYIQAGMDSFNTIMNAVWDAQDIQFDKEQEQLDKENELLDKKLNEQQEIVDRHKSAIDAIEDELATARGDRRQHLIDQLNAEMAAQRAALKQEQKIQKEKDAAQKKQDDLEKKRKKAQYQRDMLQAIVNGAMAVTYAAMNSWPIPAIPMMALAATTTAAQIAIMSSNKPYAKGGQLDGPSHREGGIKVPGIGGGIELEGQEYVIRKKSTAKNLDILDYINRSERKLSLDDFIDFYGGKVKKNVKSMSPGRKFADGGALPTLSNTYDFDDRLISAFEEYSNRQVVVSVVDINNRQAAVRNVQVLAGVENS